jgi:biofilm protein TabA
MIYDRLENVENYFDKNSTLYKAVCFARDEACKLNTGVHKLDGDALKANIDEYETEPAENRRFEAHRKYIDVQVMLEGMERHDVSVVSDLVPDIAYDSDKDVMFLQTPETCASIPLPPGLFVVYFPQDAHRPGCAIGDTPAPVRKVCMKIKTES